MSDGFRRSLDEAGAGALVVVARSSRDPDLAPFVGPIHLGDALLVAPRDGEPRLAYLTPMERDEAAATGLALLSPTALELSRLRTELPAEEHFWAAVIERALTLVDLPPGRIAVAGSGRAGMMMAVGRALESRGWVPLPGQRLSLSLRKSKDARQVREAERVAAGGATALRRVAELLASATARDGELWLEGERLRVARLRREIARTLAGFELEQPEGNIVAPAEEGAVPHSTGTAERVLRPGESLVVDLFPRGWLFADMTRTFCVGTPPEPLAAAHAAVLEALGRAHDRLAETAPAWGLRASSLQDMTCSHFARQGYPTLVSDPATTTGYVHNLGHGVGFDLHEYPSFRREAGAEGVLAEGDLLTLEPGLYDPQVGWAVRLEDLVLLEAAGPRNLTPLPYDLDPRAWQ